MDNPNTEFSRYNGEEDDRGASMVAKHMKNMVANNREAALATLKAVWPQAKDEMLVAALQGCDWDADKAYKVMAKFSMQSRGAGKKQKEPSEKKSKKEKAKHKKERKRKHSSKRNDSDSDSGSDSSDDSGDSSDSEGRSRKRSKKSKKDKKDKKDKKKKTKRVKSEAERGAVTEQFGQYGVIKEADMWDKRPEFMLWCSEMKKQDLELLSKWEEKELFKEFMEDFNTATLPHKKYYNYEAWVLSEREKSQKGKAMFKEEKSSFNDEEDRKRELQAQRMQTKNAEVNALRRTLVQSGLAADMREQQLLKQKVEMLYNTGNVVEARKLATRLLPDAL